MQRRVKSEMLPERNLPSDEGERGIYTKSSDMRRTIHASSLEKDIGDQSKDRNCMTDFEVECRRGGGNTATSFVVQRVSRKRV